MTKNKPTICYRQAATKFLELEENEKYGQTLIALAMLQIRNGKFFEGAATYEVGLENLTQLSGSQKLIRRLLGIRKGLTGGN